MATVQLDIADLEEIRNELSDIYQNLMDIQVYLNLPGGIKRNGIKNTAGRIYRMAAKTKALMVLVGIPE